MGLSSFSEGKEFEAEIRAEYIWYKKYFDRIGMKKQKDSEGWVRNH
jgi:hypothetical protein